jgi:hypothetical protein
MPARPRWHSKLDDIRQSLTGMDVPVIDRPTIEQLFGVGRRQANNLIRIHHGYQVGTSKVVARDKLLAGLEKMGAHRGVAGAETTRKSRLIEALEAIQRKPRPRRIVLPPPPPPRQASTSLPPGFTVSAPGELRLQFSTPEELLGRIQSLLEAAVKDFASFELCLEPLLSELRMYSREKHHHPGQLGAGHPNPGRSQWLKSRPAASPSRSPVTTVHSTCSSP